MSADSLLDTNVLIYLLDDTQPDKSQRAEQLVLSGLQTHSSCISQQVIQETLNIATRKLQFSIDDAQRLLNKTLLPLCEFIPIAQLYHRGLSIQSRYQYNFYDSVIIAAALEIGCKTLFSEDLQDGQQIDNLTIRNPFKD